jgi:hypothetical protein
MDRVLLKDTGWRMQGAHTSKAEKSREDMNQVSEVVNRLLYKRERRHETRHNLVLSES